MTIPNKTVPYLMSKGSDDLILFAIDQDDFGSPSCHPSRSRLCLRSGIFVCPTRQMSHFLIKGASIYSRCVAHGRTVAKARWGVNIGMIRPEIPRIRGGALTGGPDWRYESLMIGWRWMVALGAVLLSPGCTHMQPENSWRGAVDSQAAQLGYRNWIVIAEASFPAHNRPGLRQVTAPVEIPEALDYVLNALEQTENVRPQVYLTREVRSVENDFAPGIDRLRERVKNSLHGHEATELDQQSLLTLLEDANRSFDVLIIRTQSALPYSSVFLELQPGYWDASSESRLREQIERERMQKLVRPVP
jgi:hypothetical protein